MIPKKIHYCWFGGNPKPKLAQKCIRSWKKYCPDYELIEWNEENFDIQSCPLYVRQAYEAKKWAFVTDYVRLQIVYEHGGIYLDTDVKLLKSLNPFLNNTAYFGFEDSRYINTGLGFGAEKGHPILKEMMDDYFEISFVLEDGSYDMTACPKRNTYVFLRHGLQLKDERQVLEKNILILPSYYFNPLSYWTGIMQQNNETVSIHWCSSSWQSKQEKKVRDDRVRKIRRTEFWDRIKHLPNRLLIAVLGEVKYTKIKRYLKRG